MLQSTGTEVGNTEGKLDDTKDSLLKGTNGLAAIKRNTSAINNEVSNIEGKLDARGNLMTGRLKTPRCWRRAMTSFARPMISPT